MTSYWCSIVTMALSHVVYEILNVEKLSRPWNPSQESINWKWYHQLIRAIQGAGGTWHACTRQTSDRQTSNDRQHHRLMPPGRRHNKSGPHSWIDKSTRPVRRHRPTKLPYTRWSKSLTIFTVWRWCAFVLNFWYNTTTSRTDGQTDGFGKTILRSACYESWQEIKISKILWTGLYFWGMFSSLTTQFYRTVSLSMTFSYHFRILLGNSPCRLSREWLITKKVLTSHEVSRCVGGWRGRR